SEPVDPRPVLDLALGLGAGLGLGLLSALGLEALDTTIRSSEEIESVTGLPALAAIPQIGTREFGGDWKKLQAAERTAQLALMAFNQPRSPAAESYRSLRTSLLLCANGTPPKV